MSLNSGTSLHLCEDSSLAFVSSLGHLYHLDAPATVIALALEERKPRQHIVELLAKQMSTSLSVANRHIDEVEQTLWPPEPHSLKKDNEAGSMLKWRRVGPRPMSGIALREYRILDKLLRCHFRDLVSLEVATTAIGHLEVYEFGLAAADFEIGIKDGNLEVFSVGKQLDEFATPDMLINILRLALVERSLATSTDDWAIHAAAMAAGGHAVLLPGPGGRGKSTLALGLSAFGYQILGDDTVVLSHKTLEVRPLPFPLCVKEGSWELARTLLKVPKLPLNGRRLDGLCVHWLPPSAGVNLAPSDLHLEVGHIVFPTFDQDQPVHIKSLSPDDALRKLVPCLHPLGTTAMAEKVDQLILWVKGRDCYDLRYPCLNSAIGLIEELVQ